MENETPQGKETIGDVLKKYKEMKDEGTLVNPPVGNEIPPVVSEAPPTAKAVPTIPEPNSSSFQQTMSQETDPDLMTAYELVTLPSHGKFYPHGIGEVSVEYMTSKDEDILTTPSLIDSGEALNILLKRKIKTKGIVVEDLLEGDRNAIVLFLRTSSYGADYSVNVPDPRTGVAFKTVVDLLQLRYKDVHEQPDNDGHFYVDLPMRKKTVKFRLLSSGEDNQIYRSAESIKELYQQEFSEYSTTKLKAHVLAIGDKTDRSYIGKFIDAMPALDAYTIRKKIMVVSPDVDMSYEFIAKDGYKFIANLALGIDFFSPGT